MQRKEIMDCLQQYISSQVLDGKDIGLDEDTPLLEWGIVNSIEIVRLLSFIWEQFAIDIPPEKMIADHFTSIGAIADLVLQTQERLGENRSYT